MSEDTPTEDEHPALRLSYGFDATREPELEIWDAGDDDYKNIPPRKVRRDRPIETDITPVTVRGQALHPVLWRGRQWAVTEYGIERLDGTYCIEAKRLIEDIQEWGWPAHMQGKTWVDREEFATAWLVALVLHGKKASKADIKAALARG